MEVKIKSVLVLHFGGTIGMQRNKFGVYVPSTTEEFTSKIKNEIHDPTALQYCEALHSNEVIIKGTNNNFIKFTIYENWELLDSSNISLHHWIKIATVIQHNYENYNGFVILHGTDTLAYTASALSFMFEGLEKPIILTGSQIPIFETRSDAKDNLLSSIILAGCYNIPEVCILFAGKLLRGNRAVKTSSNQLNAFKSLNYHVLADCGIDIKIYDSYINQSNGSLKVYTNLNGNVGVLSFFPTITCEMLEACLRYPTAGLVILSYGSGNIPSKRTELLEIFKRAVSSEILIVNITQCQQGSVKASYEPGKEIQDIGIISGKDMTCEAALTKLCFVLGLENLSYSEKVQYMKTNLRGELTEHNATEN